MFKRFLIGTLLAVVGFGSVYAIVQPNIEGFSSTTTINPTTVLMIQDGTTQNKITALNFASSLTGVLGINMYNSDGTLTTDRTVIGGGHSITFGGLSNFLVMGNPATFIKSDLAKLESNASSTTYLEIQGLNSKLYAEDELILNSVGDMEILSDASIYVNAPAVRLNYASGTMIGDILGTTFAGEVAYYNTGDMGTNEEDFTSKYYVDGAISTASGSYVHWTDVSTNTGGGISDILLMSQNAISGFVNSSIAAIPANNIYTNNGTMLGSRTIGGNITSLNWSNFFNITQQSINLDFDATYFDVDASEVTFDSTTFDLTGDMTVVGLAGYSSTGDMGTNPEAFAHKEYVDLEIAGLPTSNLYTADGTLTGNRTVNGGGYDLDVTNTQNVAFNASSGFYASENALPALGGPVIGWGRPGSTDDTILIKNNSMIGLSILPNGNADFDGALETNSIYVEGYSTQNTMEINGDTHKMYNHYGSGIIELDSTIVELNTTRVILSGERSFAINASGNLDVQYLSGSSRETASTFTK